MVETIKEGVRCEGEMGSKKNCFLKANVNDFYGK